MKSALGMSRALATAALRWLVALITVGVLGAGAAITTASATAGAAGIPRPSHQSFYRYHGRTPLSALAPGTPLKTRSVTLALGTNASPLPARQILYRTTDARGKAVASVTTVLLPATGTVDPKVVAYLSFYDALSNRCDPSYTLRGGNPGAANEQDADIEQTLVSSLRADGYIVTVPDFENETLDYVAGTESGMSALDGIKATLRVLGLAKSTPTGLMGYSGGSIAADWGSELAPHYAPRLHLVGVAEGGIPVDLAHNLSYVNGSQEWSSVIPAAMIGISRSFGVPLDHYLSPYGRKVVAAESHQCIGQFLGKYPGLTMARLVKPRFADVTKVPVFRRIVNRLIMGSVPGHPKEPLFMVAGNSDGTGDGVMVEGDEDALAYEYCHQGVPVDFEQLTGMDHNDAGAAFFPQAFSYLAQRFLGAPPPSNCSSIPPGNSLAPIR